MKTKTIILTFLIFTTSCYIGNDNDAYIWFTWTIDGYPASHIVCSDKGGHTVVMEEDPYGDGLPRWRMTFPCHSGVGRTSWHFESYETTYIRFRLLDDADAIISETSWEPFWPYPGENFFEVDFETSPYSGLDAAIHLEWTIDDAQAGSSTCSEAGATTVRIEYDENGDNSSEWDFEFSCPAGDGTTDYDFYSGYSANLRFILLGNDGVVSSTNWETTLLQRGVNDFVVNFNTPVIPPDTAYLTLDWSIHFVPGDAEICNWADSGKVRLMMDNDNDGEEDSHFEFDCESASGATDDVFEPGQIVHFAFALMDTSGEAISVTSGWETFTLSAGENNLGSVNFFIGDFGPLGVELQWADSTGETPSYGGCDFPPQPVSKIGYLLKSEDGTVYDVADIDEAPLDCANYLYWYVVDFGTYELVIEGEDETGGAIWGSTCPDLLIDSYEEGSNEFTCRVEMTPGP